MNTTIKPLWNVTFNGRDARRSDGRLPNGADLASFDALTPESEYSVEYVAELLAAGYHVHYGMALNVGPILSGGRRTGHYGFWHHDGKGPNLKHTSDYVYSPAKAFLGSVHAVKAAAREVRS
jgi:hypothetical protein